MTQRIYSTLLYSITVFLLQISFRSDAQELFIHNEPASSIPKHVLGIRLFGESYNEFGVERNMGACRIMYGLTSKLSVSVTGTVSNHHSDRLPSNLVSHTHSGDQTIYQTGTFNRGLKYPYRMNGIYFYSKYRFLTLDAEHKHFRMAAYGEGSYISSAHDETEPNLLDDTKGIGGGIIATYLYHHFAASFTGGLILPGHYSEYAPDFFGGQQHTVIQYGNAVIYNLSAGYLVYPVVYKKYTETNLNIYIELMGKSYASAGVYQNGVGISPKTDLLIKGNYVEIHPGMQFIIDSNLRIDFSIGAPLINKSYTRFYPVYTLGIQRYFFL